uniref:Uncharacterized protein n=1 Tax=Rhizophora mucronata TaxID=61149 RepID=A0A2P2NQN1_RHIMU
MWPRITASTADFQNTTNKNKLKDRSQTDPSKMPHLPQQRDTHTSAMKPAPLPPPQVHMVAALEIKHWKSLLDPSNSTI